jgi:hypothetical protein
VFFKLFALISIAVVFLQCKTVETTMEVGDTVTVEAESFAIQNATVVSDKKVSNGKAGVGYSRSGVKIHSTCHLSSFLPRQTIPA